MRFLWNFYLYSFFGFLLEVGFSNLTHSAKQDRKCLLFLPFCPVYGLSAALLLAFPLWMRRGFGLFVLGFLIPTGVEYAFHWFYQQRWKVTFWDYSGLPGAIHGRVCLPFSLCWAGLSFGLVWLDQQLSPFLSALPEGLLLPMTLLFSADLMFTSALLRKTHDTNSLIWYR